MRKKLGEVLVDLGATTADEVKNALGHQRRDLAGQRIGEILLSMGKVTADQVAQALSLQFDLPWVQLPEIPAAVSMTIPVDIQSEHRVVPFRIESDGKVERLHLAVADPSQLGVIDELRFQLGKPVQVWIASSTDIDEVLRALRGEQDAEIDAIEVDEEVEELVVERDVTQQIPSGRFGALPNEWMLPPPGTSATATATAQLDDLLGQPAPAVKRVEVVKFEPRPKSAPATPAPAPVPPAPPQTAPPSTSPTLDFSDADLAILEKLEGLGSGDEAGSGSANIKPAQMVASLIRLLIRKGVIQESEFLEEVTRK